MNITKATMISLTDSQIAILKAVAAIVPVEKRDLLLQRTAALLALMKFRSRTDDDFRDAVIFASTGLCQSDGFVIPGMSTG